MSKRKNLLALIGTLILLVSLSVPMMQCAPAAEEAGAYEDYVASVPEGCFPVPRECFEQAMEEGELYIYDWVDWIPAVILEGFEEEFGIKVTIDPLTSTDEQVAKFKLNPDTPYDITTTGPKGYQRLALLNVLRELNHDWLPNANAFMPEPVFEIRYGPEHPYTVPMDGFFFNVYGYNKKYVDEADPRVGSLALLFDAEEYAGKITMIDDMFDCVGAALMYLGYSFNSVDEGELMEAKEVLLRQKPWVLAYDSQPTRLVLEDEAWIFMWWVGNIRDQMLEYPGRFGMVLPEEGAVLDFEQMVFPIGSKNPAAAHLFANYFHRPEAYIEFITHYPSSLVNTAAIPLLPEGWEDFPEINPSEEYLAKCEPSLPIILTGKGLELRAAVWEEVKG